MPAGKGVTTNCDVCEDGRQSITHFVPNTFACSACGRSWHANEYVKINVYTLQIWHDIMQGIGKDR